PPAEGGDEGLAADGGLDDVVHVGHLQAVARERRAVGNDVHVEPAEVALEEGAARTGYAGEQAFELHADLLDRVEVRPVDLDAHRGADRSEERRVGKEWRSRWSPYQLEKRTVGWKSCRNVSRSSTSHDPMVTKV